MYICIYAFDDHWFHDFSMIIPTIILISSCIVTPQKCRTLGNAEIHRKNHQPTMLEIRCVFFWGSRYCNKNHLDAPSPRGPPKWSHDPGWVVPKGRAAFLLRRATKKWLCSGEFVWRCFAPHWNNSKSRSFHPNKPPLIKDGNWKSSINGVFNLRTENHLWLIDGRFSIVMFDYQRVHKLIFAIIKLPFWEIPYRAKTQATRSESYCCPWIPWQTSRSTNRLISYPEYVQEKSTLTHIQCD